MFMLPHQSRYIQPLTPDHFSIALYLILSPLSVVFAVAPLALLISLMTGYYPQFIGALKLSAYLGIGYYVLALPLLILLHAFFRRFALLNIVSIFLSNILIYSILLITFEYPTLWQSLIWMILFNIGSTAFYLLFCYAEIGSDEFDLTS